MTTGRWDVARRASIAVRSAGLAAVTWRLVRSGRPARPIERSDGPPGRAITVVVPARDEADRIRPLLDAVVDAPGVATVLVVDDESSDATAEVAAAAGATVIAGASRPDGWAGKTWALQQGVAAATTEWVVTLDADTRPDPCLPTAIVDRMAADGLDLLTAAGRFDCPTTGAQWLHPAMLTTLVYRFGPPGGERTGPRVLANGQCMALRREPFIAAGGFEPVAGSVVEDVALARHSAAGGRRVAFLDAGGLLDVRMFESIGDTWRGWGRSLGLPGVEPRWRRAVDVAVLAVTMPLPLVRIAVGWGDPVDLAALAIRLGTLAGTRRAYVRPGAAYWLSPLADGPAVVALAAGLVRRNQTWRGRRYAV